MTDKMPKEIFAGYVGNGTIWGKWREGTTHPSNAKYLLASTVTAKLERVKELADESMQFRIEIVNLKADLKAQADLLRHATDKIAYLEKESDGMPCVGCGKPSDTATPDDADMCYKCFGEFNACEYDSLKKENKAKLEAAEKMAAALEKIAKRPDLPNPERDADWKNCQKLSSHDAEVALQNWKKVNK